MNAVQDIETAETTEHGSECFCQICRPQIVDEEPQPEPIRVFFAE